MQDCKIAKKALAEVKKLVFLNKNMCFTHNRGPRYIYVYIYIYRSIHYRRKLGRTSVALKVIKLAACKRVIYELHVKNLSKCWKTRELANRRGQKTWPCVCCAKSGKCVNHLGRDCTEARSERSRNRLRDGTVGTAVRTFRESNLRGRRGTFARSGTDVVAGASLWHGHVQI